MVPIVEPEVLMDGDHTLARCAEVTEAVLHEVFHALHRHRVALEHMLLKPSMVVPGKQQPAAGIAGRGRRADDRASCGERCRRPCRASIFLSGGQTPAEATANLDAINRLGPQPWLLSFSYGRALQEPALQAWKGQAANARRRRTRCSSARG